MDTFNVFSDESWDRENDREGYRHKATVIGDRLGASLPDSGKVGIWTRGGGYQAMLYGEPNLDYWEGEA